MDWSTTVGSCLQRSPIYSARKGISLLLRRLQQNQRRDLLLFYRVVIRFQLCGLDRFPFRQLFVRVLADAVRVVHEEHQPITLPRGTYRVWGQREYSPEAIRRVLD